MKKTILLIITISVLALLLLFLAIVMRKPPETLPTGIPSPYPTRQVKRERLYVVSTRPPNQTQDVSGVQPIVVTFNRVFRMDEIAFSIAPRISYSLSVADTNLIVTPTEEYARGTPYVYTIKFADPQELPTSFSFTIGGPKPTFLPDTQPSGAAQAEEDFERENYPDVFLRNKTPYVGTSFSIESFFKAASGHFAFMVTLQGDQNQAKVETNTWMKSLGLTEAQILRLDIAYQ